LLDRCVKRIKVRVQDRCVTRRSETPRMRTARVITWRFSIQRFIRHEHMFPCATDTAEGLRIDSVELITDRAYAERMIPRNAYQLGVCS
jgi:hypothetical protein